MFRFVPCVKWLKENRDGTASARLTTSDCILCSQRRSTPNEFGVGDLAIELPPAELDTHKMPSLYK